MRISAQYTIEICFLKLSTNRHPTPELDSIMGLYWASVLRERVQYLIFVDGHKICDCQGFYSQLEVYRAGTAWLPARVGRHPGRNGPKLDLGHSWVS